MGIYKFIKILGPEGARTGYFVPRMYQLVWSWHTVKTFGFSYVKERLQGYTIWYVTNEEDYVQAIEVLEELKKTRIFDYRVS